jgi:hypothetical protein
MKAPCTNLNAESCFPISSGSKLARVIRDTKIFVLDEVSMAHNHLMTGIDRLFKDIMQDGGELVFMSGNFRQNLPIIAGGSEEQITNACLKRSPLWSTVTNLGLTENMRGRNRTESERSYIEHNNAFLFAMGDGSLPDIYPEKNPYLVRLPSSMCMYVTDDEAGMTKLMRDVYNDVHLA